MKHTVLASGGEEKNTKEVLDTAPGLTMLSMQEGGGGGEGECGPGTR